MAQKAPETGLIRSLSTQTRSPARTGLDLNAARHCADITASHYRHARAELPETLRRHFAWLEGGSDCGTQLLSSAETAEMLGVSERYVRRIAQRLGGRRVGATWVLDRRAVMAWKT